MTKSTLKDKSIEDLKKSVVEKREALRQFRFGANHAKTKDNQAGHNLKIEVARILTEINSR